MPSHNSERSLSHGRSKKDRQNNSSGLARVDIPPPHLHAPSQLYQQSVQLNGDAQLEIVSHPDHRGTETSYDHFVSEHEIKFTRNEVCTPTSCICFFIALLFLFMAIMSGLLYGLNFFDGKQIKERVFKVQFALFDQDLATSNLENVESDKFKSVASLMKKRVEQLFRESSLDRLFVKSEIVAFERRQNRPSEVLVHLDVHVTATKRTVDSSEIYLIFAEEFANNRLKLFSAWTIDHNSLDVQERRWAPREKSALLVNPWTYKSIFPGMLEGLKTESTPAPRRCMSIGLGYCRFLSYNRTSYPNALNHWNLSSIEEDFLIFKEIIDSECYSLSKEFLCLLLQPECVDNEIVLPCKSFCAEFLSACQRWLPERLSNKIVCDTYPESNLYPHSTSRPLTACRDKPNCASILRLQSQQRKICDGVQDCSLEESPNDESNCNYCGGKDQFHCGNQQCVSREATCDGTRDCNNGADEHNCFSLVSSPHNKTQKKEELSEGYLVATFKGKESFVCSQDSLTHMQNYSHMYYNNQLQILGLNICNERQFDELIHIESKHVALNGPFSKFLPGTTLVSPYSSQCRNREIYYVECAIPKCGVSGAHAVQDAVPFEQSKAFPGYWPWWAKINFNNNYFCDGTLVSPDTVLAQAACFSHEHSSLLSKSQNLSVSLGSVRFYNDNVEMHKFFVSQVTPLSVTGMEQKLNLIRLSVPANVSRNIRPICHNTDALGQVNTSSLNCVLLGINFEADQLQSRVVRIVNMQQCFGLYNTTNSTTTDSSWSQSHQLCVQLSEESPSSAEDCINGECGGRHLYCQFKFIWYLFGVESNSTRAVTARRHFSLFDSVTKFAL